MRIGAIILAAGEANRFGSNKLIKEVYGVPIIRRVVSAVEGIDKVIVVGKYYQELMRILEDQVVLYNPYWSKGMSTSLKLGIRFFQDYDGVIVLLGDMPFITRDTVNRIIQSFTVDCDMVVPTHKGVRGNPVLLHKRTFPLIMNLEGDIGARAIMDKVKKICYVESGEEVLIDVDTPSDLTSKKHP